MHPLFIAALVAATGALAAPGETAPAPPASAGSEEERKKLEADIAKELGAAPGASAAPPSAGPGTPPADAGATPAAPAQGQAGGNPFARILLLPDISAIGSFALAWNQLDAGALSPRSDPFAPAHTVQPVFQELELGLQAVVDPYARADAFLAFGSEGVEIEEAYLTTLGLPLSLQARAGKLFAPFGRVNQQHGHVWDFVDRPLALVRLLAPDGLKGPGLDVAWLAPVSWYAELHLAYLAAAPAFEPSERNGGYARLVQFFDVGDTSTLGVGVSAGRLQEQGGGGSRDLLGADAYLKIRPARSRSYVALQAEVVARHLDGAAPPDGAALAIDVPGTAWGGYVQAVLRDGPYVEYGVRVERAPAEVGGGEERASLLAAWLPSEFERLRAQLSYDRLPGGRDGLEALLQLEFAIGAHGAHPF
ncbi:MAG: hypothetical protein ACJ79L_19490 [Anaeromyxobacteraceae bacterium]